MSWRRMRMPTPPGKVGNKLAGHLVLEPGAAELIFGGQVKEELGQVFAYIAAMAGVAL